MVVTDSTSDDTPKEGHWVAPAPSDPDLTKKIKKEIANATKKVPPSSAVQSCTLADAKAEKEAQDKKCTFTALKISKEERKFDLVVNRSTLPPNRTLEIVAGYKRKPAKVSFILEGPVGPCPETHNQKRSFDSGSGSYKILPASTENKLEVELVSNTLIRLTPWDVELNKYTISGNRCGHGPQSASITVYPDLEFNVSFGWDFAEVLTRTDERVELEQKTGNRKAAAANARKGKGILETTTSQKKTTKEELGFVLSGSIKYDGMEKEIDKIFKKTVETVERVNKVGKKAKVALETISGAKEDAAATNAKISPVSMGMRWPVIKLELGGAWVEDAGKPTVSYEGRIKLEGDPFIGFGFEWDITSTVLKAIPGGAVVDVTLKKLKAGLLKLVIKAEAVIAGEVELFIKNKKIDKVVGKVDGKIPISAELTVIKGEVESRFIHASVEYKVGVDTGFRVGLAYSTNEKVLVSTGGMLDFVVWYSGEKKWGFGKKSTTSNPYGQRTTTKTTTTNTTRTSESRSILYTKEFENEENSYVFFKYDFKTHTFIS